MNEAVIAIAATEARHAFEECESPRLEEKVRAAMRVTFSHYMLTGEGPQFSAAIAGVLTSKGLDPSVKVDLEKEAKSAIVLSMAITPGAIPVDLERVELPENSVGILRIWNEVAGRWKPRKFTRLVISRCDCGKAYDVSLGFGDGSGWPITPRPECGCSAWEIVQDWPLDEVNWSSHEAGDKESILEKLLKLEEK